MTRYAVIKTSDFNVTGYNETVRGAFKEIVQNGISYMLLFAFSNHIEGFKFDYIFETKQGYETWLKQGVDTAITSVEYNWQNDKALITIADTNFPGPHEFSCNEEWTTEDCQEAIKEKFNQ